MARTTFYNMYESGISLLTERFNTAIPQIISYVLIGKGLSYKNIDSEVVVETNKFINMTQDLYRFLNIIRASYITNTIDQIDQKVIQTLHAQLEKLYKEICMLMIAVSGSAHIINIVKTFRDNKYTNHQNIHQILQ